MILLVGALSLGIAGCDTKPEDMDLKQRLKLFTERSNQGFNPITTEENLEQGYPDPSKLEVHIRDQNQNGKYEVVMAYEGQLYLMKYDKEQNRVSLVPYEKKIDLIPKK